MVTKNQFVVAGPMQASYIVISNVSYLTIKYLSEPVLIPFVLLAWFSILHFHHWNRLSFFSANF